MTAARNKETFSRDLCGTPLKMHKSTSLRIHTVMEEFVKKWRLPFNPMAVSNTVVYFFDVKEYRVQRKVG